MERITNLVDTILTTVLIIIMAAMLKIRILSLISRYLWSNDYKYNIQNFYLFSKQFYIININFLKFINLVDM